jgi:O-antigen/teichoic acid export membrane protein
MPVAAVRGQRERGHLVSLRTRGRLASAIVLAVGLVLAWFAPDLRPVVLGEPPELWRAVVSLAIVGVLFLFLDRAVRLLLHTA